MYTYTHIHYLHARTELRVPLVARQHQRGRPARVQHLHLSIPPQDARGEHPLLLPLRQRQGPRRRRRHQLPLPLLPRCLPRWRLRILAALHPRYPGHRAPVPQHPVGAPQRHAQGLHLIPLPLPLPILGPLPILLLLPLPLRLLVGLRRLCFGGEWVHAFHVSKPIQPNFSFHFPSSPPPTCLK